MKSANIEEFKEFEKKGRFERLMEMRLGKACWMDDITSEREFRM